MGPFCFFAGSCSHMFGLQTGTLETDSVMLRMCDCCRLDAKGETKKGHFGWARLWPQKHDRQANLLYGQSTEEPDSSADVRTDNWPRMFTCRFTGLRSGRAGKSEIPPPFTVVQHLKRDESYILMRWCDSLQLLQHSEWSLFIV